MCRDAVASWLGSIAAAAGSSAGLPPSSAVLVALECCCRTVPGFASTTYSDVLSCLTPAVLAGLLPVTSSGRASNGGSTLPSKKRPRPGDNGGDEFVDLELSSAVVALVGGLTPALLLDVGSRAHAVSQPDVAVADDKLFLLLQLWNCEQYSHAAVQAAGRACMHHILTSPSTRSLVASLHTHTAVLAAFAMAEAVDSVAVNSQPPFWRKLLASVTAAHGEGAAQQVCDRCPVMRVCISV
jgi:hypothetical protein